MDAGVYRRGVVELGYRQGRGGVGAMRERNRRAREYSRMCQLKRWYRRLAIMDIGLMAALVAAVLWLV